MGVYDFEGHFHNIRRQINIRYAYTTGSWKGPAGSTWDTYIHKYYRYKICLETGFLLGQALSDHPVRITHRRIAWCVYTEAGRRAWDRDWLQQPHVWPSHPPPHQIEDDEWRQSGGKSGERASERERARAARACLPNFHAPGNAIGMADGLHQQSISGTGPESCSPASSDLDSTGKRS